MLLMQPSCLRFTKINPSAVKSSNLLFWVFAVKFTTNQNSADLISVHQSHHSTAFIFMLLLSMNKQAKPQEWFCFNKQMKVFFLSPCPSPFFYSSTILCFSPSLCFFFSECDNAPCNNILTVASRQHIKILHETY